MTTSPLPGPHPTRVLAGRPVSNLRTIRPLVFASCLHPACDWFTQSRDAFRVRTAARRHTEGATTMAKRPTTSDRMLTDEQGLRIGWQADCACGEHIEVRDDPETEGAMLQVLALLDQHMDDEH